MKVLKILRLMVPAIALFSWTGLQAVTVAPSDGAETVTHLAVGSDETFVIAITVTDGNAVEAGTINATATTPLATETDYAAAAEFMKVELYSNDAEGFTVSMSSAFDGNLKHSIQTDADYCDDEVGQGEGELASDEYCISYEIDCDDILHQERDGNQAITFFGGSVTPVDLTESVYTRLEDAAQIVWNAALSADDRGATAASADTTGEAAATNWRGVAEQGTTGNNELHCAMRFASGDDFASVKASDTESKVYTDTITVTYAGLSL